MSFLCLFLVSGYFFFNLSVEFSFLNTSVALGNAWLGCQRKKFRLCTKLDRSARGTISLKLWKAGEHNKDKRNGVSVVQGKDLGSLMGTSAFRILKQLYVCVGEIYGVTVPWIIYVNWKIRWWEWRKKNIKRNMKLLTQENGNRHLPFLKKSILEAYIWDIPFTNHSAGNYEIDACRHFFFFKNASNFINWSKTVESGIAHVILLYPN